MHKIPGRHAAMSLGLAERQGSLLNDMEQFCDQKLSERSIYTVLHRERDLMFPTRCSRTSFPT
ncbi:MAG: hypothetical protein M0008_11245 [Actinomycetota bacterium]|nr:hypothetical protein [Actinomycetota bacterium]